MTMATEYGVGYPNGHMQPIMPPAAPTTQGDEPALPQSAEYVAAEYDGNTMVALIAHELRTPLTVLLGQATLLQRRLVAHDTIEPRDRLAAATLVAQTLQLKDLISALLDAAQFDYGQLRLAAAPLDLAILVERIVDTLAPTLPTHRLQLYADPNPLWVMGDALRLEQVLHNLLQNAAKYSPTGSTITLSIAHKDEQVQISVSDQGIGIPLEAQPYLFQRNYRVKAVNLPVTGGLGLGLYISKAIIDLHKGSIGVESREGHGCTVNLSLPCMM